ncbi:MAG: protein phosphatase 2C domain-containing protein [Gammaproteobacteria bacterium]
MNSNSSDRRVFSNDIEDADIDLPFGRVSVRLRCSPHHRHSEDAIAVLPVADHGVVLAVADGVGGSPGGRDAALIVLESLRVAVAMKADSDLQQAIFAAIEAANLRLIEQGIGAGTTIVVAEIIDGRLRSYHVGDSEIAVVGQRGKVKRRVTPHSPTGFAIETGLITEDEAMHHEYRHILLNVIGAPSMRVEAADPIELARRDTVLLASDGLLDNLYMSEILEEARCGALPASADNLVKLASDRMSSMDGAAPSKPDDLSLILYRGK